MADTSPELVLHNGKIVTVDDDFSIVQALAVAGERIVATGTDADVLAGAGPGTERIDLGGRTVVPGLIDGHPHMDSWRGRFPRLAGSKNMADIRARVARAVADVREKGKPGAWVVLQLLADPETRAPACFEEGRYPNRHDLDPVSPDNPVWIRGTYRTPSIVNSRALELAGITAETPQPERLAPILDWRSGDTVVSPGGEIEKDPATGEPTGVLRDNDTLIARPATGRLWELAPRPTLEACIANLEDKIAEFNRLGLTAIYEGHGLEDPVEEGTLALLKVWSEGGLTVRVQMVPNLNTSGTLEDVSARLGGYAYAAHDGAGDDRLRFAGVNVTLDGPGGGLDAVQPKQPSWPGPHDEIRDGICRVPLDKFRHVAREAARRGVRLATKADGEAMIDWVIDVYGETDAEFGIRDRRWVMMHSKFTTPAQMARLRELGVVPTTCATFVWHHGKNLARAYGDAVARRAVPLRGFLDAGLPVSNGSDEYPWNPFFSLWLMVTRTDGETGAQLGGGECVSREEALRIYTNNGAWLLRMEDRLGSLEAGKYADLLVLSDDYLTVEAGRIKDISPVMTVVGGRIVHADPDAGL